MIRFTPEQVEAYRALAASLLRDKYDDNQTAMARALDIHNTAVRRFVVLKKGGLSSRTAEHICKLAGVPYPLGSTKPTSPPPAVGAVDVELEKTLDYFTDGWSPEVQTLARQLAARRGIRLSRDAWREKLDEFEKCIDELTK